MNTNAKKYTHNVHTEYMQYVYSLHATKVHCIQFTNICTHTKFYKKIITILYIQNFIKDYKQLYVYKVAKTSLWRYSYIMQTI